jgi:hypothetical protein
VKYYSAIKLESYYLKEKEGIGYHDAKENRLRKTNIACFLSHVESRFKKPRQKSMMDSIWEEEEIYMINKHYIEYEHVKMKTIKMDENKYKMYQNKHVTSMFDSIMIDSRNLFFLCLLIQK